MRASELAVHHAPEPAGVHRAGGELPGGLHHHLRGGQQGEAGLLLVRGTSSSPLIGSLLMCYIAGPAEENVRREPGGWD